MSEADYYAPGSYHDSSAPWNEHISPEKKFDITVSQTLSKVVSITTNNYNELFDDECGSYYADTEDTCWSDEFDNNDLHTPLQLIQILREYLQKELDSMEKVSYSREHINKKRRLTKLIEECKDWCDDETEYAE